MLACGLCNVNIAFTSSSDVVVLVVCAWSESYLWDRNLVLALSGLDAGRSDVCCSSATSTESTIAVVTDNSFADDFTITIAMYMLVFEVGS